jgi:hypothetical protein
MEVIWKGFRNISITKNTTIFCNYRKFAFLNGWKRGGNF